MTEDRHPAWDGAYNLADLGGLPLRDGGRTVHGRVFRSGRPETLSDVGWSAMRAAGITTIIDLRNEQERIRYAWDPVVRSDATEGIRIVSAPTEDPDDPEFMRVCGPLLDHPLSYPDNLRFYPERFAAVFRAIAAAPGGVLFHCSGGRDRTGMVAAMLLSFAGVRTEAIGDDYAQAFRTASRHVARQTAAHPERRHETPYADDEIEQRIADRIPAITEWIDGLDVAEYLREAGLSAQEVATLGGLLRR